MLGQENQRRKQGKNEVVRERRGHIQRVIAIHICNGLSDGRFELLPAHLARLSSYAVSFTRRLVRLFPLELLVIPGVESEAAVLVANPAEGPLAVDLILHLHRCILRSGYIGRERHVQLAGGPLLYRDARARLLSSVTAELRIDRELRDARDLRDPAGDLAGDLRRDQRLRAQRCRLRRRGVGGLFRACQKRAGE